jgi:XisH protein
MARRDIHHQVLKLALEREGWNVTDDPFFVKIGRKTAEIDLGAERIILAERATEKIAVEVKSFVGTSMITEFYKALGQFLMYQRALQTAEPERTLYLALPQAAYDELSADVFDFPNFEDLRHRLIIYQPSENTTLTWIL